MKADAPVEVATKDDASPLTEADRRAHQLIIDALSGLPEGLPILSEESEAISYDERSGWQTYWLVDPLDGTKEFISRNGEFTVNIALIDNGIARAGVVHVPVSGSAMSVSSVMVRGKFNRTAQRSGSSLPP